MNKKATDIVAYIGIIGWVIAYFAGTKDESKFHLNQGLILAIGEIAVTILSRIGGVIAILMWLVSVFLFVLWLIAFIGACKGEEKVMPVLGGIQILK